MGWPVKRQGGGQRPPSKTNFRRILAAGTMAGAVRAHGVPPAASAMHAPPTMSDTQHISVGRGVKWLLGLVGIKETPTKFDASKTSATMDMAQGGFARYDDVFMFSQTTFTQESGVSQDDLVIPIVAPEEDPSNYWTRIPNYRPELSTEQTLPPHLVPNGKYQDYETRVLELSWTIYMSPNVANGWNNAAPGFFDRLKFDLYTRSRTAPIPESYIHREGSREGVYPFAFQDDPNIFTWSLHRDKVLFLSRSELIPSGNPGGDIYGTSVAGDGTDRVFNLSLRSGISTIDPNAMAFSARDWRGWVPAKNDLYAVFRFGSLSNATIVAINNALADGGALNIQVSAHAVQVGRNARLPE